MTDSRLLGRGAVSIVFAAAVLVPGVASATSDDGAGQSTLKLTVTESQKSRTVTLTCDPASGEHPRASDACEELQQVDGKFERLDPGEPKTCTKESRQVSASAEGTWRGQPVGYQVKLANPCALKAATGSVFDF
ncbi:SSI family serine proteinase inhibitor [Saccharopolyspora sp. NPDC050389]|uniref:SSI family serine proteinase inhibitor n=1 Tax=Saccharopolyspora sp. NPDC050389 TaxID=3155516 RepID=UPI0033FE11BB